MIVGDGMIARGFKSSNEDYSNHIIFASGVSNSKEINDDEYNREKKLILKTISENKGLKFIYFSSVLAGITKNKYYKAKLEFEEVIKANSSDYIIFRLPQLIGNSGNPNNLVNYLKNSILFDKEITIYDNVERSLVDVDDLIKVVNYCKDRVSCEILNFSGIEKIKVLTLCKLIAILVNKTPVLKVINNFENNDWTIINSKIIMDTISHIESVDYNNRVLKKYILNDEGNHSNFCI